VTDQNLPNYNYPVSTIIMIDGRPHKPPVYAVPGRLMLMDCHTGQPFLVPDGEGGTAMPSDDDYERLIIDGRIEVAFPENVIASRTLASTAEFEMTNHGAIAPGRPPAKSTQFDAMRAVKLPKRTPPADATRYPELKRICGKHGEIIFDNASEPTGHGIGEAATWAGISIRLCPVWVPSYRAILERMHGTIERKMLENRPGAAGRTSENRRSKRDGAKLRATVHYPDGTAHSLPIAVVMNMRTRMISGGQMS
jgi:hypothetical protein